MFHVWISSCFITLVSRQECLSHHFHLFANTSYQYRKRFRSAFKVKRRIISQSQQTMQQQESHREGGKKVVHASN